MRGDMGIFTKKKPSGALRGGSGFFLGIIPNSAFGLQRWSSMARDDIAR
jgi:hypothetical protein